MEQNKNGIYQVSENPLETSGRPASLYFTSKFADEVGSEFIADFENPINARLVCKRLNDYKYLQAKCDRYEKALKDIAKQHKIDEMDANDCDGDISEGYDAIINVAREALSAGEGGKEVETKRVQPDLGNCQRCGITPATTTYSDLKVCAHCDKMLNDEFEREYQ
jgi:hypothetical protein